MCLALIMPLSMRLITQTRCHYMLRAISLFFSISCLCSASVAIAEDVVKHDIAPLVVTIDADVHRDYLTYIDGRDPLSIDSYGGEGSRRDVVEVLLLQQAMALGGIDAPFEFRIVRGYLDSLDVLASGEALLRATPVWGADCDNKSFYVSEPVIRQGEFQVGLYTRPQNDLSSLTLPLNQLSAVTNHDLKADLNTLKQLGIAKIFDVERWPTMIAMVATGEADVILAPFQDTAGMEMVVGDTRLMPIPDIKVALADTRHWVVSRNNVDGGRVSKALEKGLAQQRKSGTIVRAYTESGFFHPSVKSWALLNAQVQTSTEQPVHMFNIASH